MNDLSLRIPTNQLQKLLEGQPGVMLKLESMACEKIAEEIMRKASSADLKKLTEDVVNKAMSQVNLSIKDPHRWPTETQGAIEKLVLRHLKDQRVAMIDDFRKEMETLEKSHIANCEKAVNEHFALEMEKYRAEIQQLAQDSFFKVVREAQSVRAAE